MLTAGGRTAERRGADWFDVDRAGLAELATRGGVPPLILEPIQNSWDEDSSVVSLDIEPIAGKALARLVVRDDSPDGFRDLADAYTMFRQSYKLADPEKRGRFNIGEKLLLAIATEARITSTTGSIIFAPTGRKAGRKKTEAGSILEATIKITRADLDEAVRLAMTLIPPKGIETTINGVVLSDRTEVTEEVRTLQTEIRGEDGGFRPTRRKTTITIYDTVDGEQPTLYEMGIPVDTLGCPWHVDVGQKVPLSLDRTAVRQAFKLDLERHVAEMMATMMTGDQAQGGWLDIAFESMEDEAAIKAATLKRFGKAVLHDPAARESNKLAIDAGYAVIRDRQLSTTARRNMRSAGAIKRSSKLFDSGQVESDPVGESPIPHHQYTPAMKNLAKYAQDFAMHVSGRTPVIKMWNNPGLPFAGMGGGNILGFNVAKLRITNQGSVDRLLIHECAHFVAKDHLTHRFHEECCRIGESLRSFKKKLPNGK